MASHDPTGNMTGDGTHTYQWDAENRMVSVDSGSTATQNYNALGQRVERFLPNGSWTFDYLFGLGGEELGLYSAGTAAWFDQNVPMAGRVLVMYGSPSRFLHANKLGTTTVTTDQTGSELQDELFYPWGQNWTRAGQPYVMHFAGMQNFENPGLVYPTDFRRYNPALGRWMSPDPLAGDVSNPQSLNRYAYVLNNPVSNTDPSGLFMADPGEDVASVDVIPINDYNNSGLVPSMAPVLPGSGADVGGASAGDDVSKHYESTMPCSSTASQVMGAVESNFPRFGNYSRWGGSESVTFSPPSDMGPGSTIPISVSVFGFTTKLSVTVQSMNSKSMTFTTNPGHLLYPAHITFAASPASGGAVNFNINLSGTVTKPFQFYLGGSSFEDAQWKHFLGQVGGFCKRGE